MVVERFKQVLIGKSIAVEKCQFPLLRKSIAVSPQSPRCYGNPQQKRPKIPLLLGFSIAIATWACQAKPTIEEQFTLKDLTPPQVISISPANGETEVSNKPTIVIVFNEPMDAATLNSATVTVKTTNGTLGVGSYEYDSTTNALAIKIVQSLYLNTQYTITITDKVKDKAGNAIAPVTSSFTTDECPKARVNRPVFNNQVNAIVKVGCTLFVGGTFTEVGNASSYGFALDASSANTAEGFTYEDINDWVLTAVPDGANGWYIGGKFTRVGNKGRKGAAQLAGNGEVLTWNPEVSGEVKAIAVGSDYVVLGGVFSAVKGAVRSNLAVIGKDGTLKNWTPNLNASVEALALATIAGSDAVIVGGGLWYG